MTSSQWDTVYSKKGMAMYPDNMLVRFVAKNYYNSPNRKDVKFLDVGCGIGASTWYLAREGFSVAAIDGSLVAIQRLKKRLEDEKLEATLMCGDISNLEFKENYFDAVVDVGSLCYIPDNKIQGVMTNLKKVLKPGGRIFSLTPTTKCAKELFNNTIEGVELGSRFLTEGDIVKQFKGFEVRMSTCTYEAGMGLIADLWVIDGVKASS